MTTTLTERHSNSQFEQTCSSPPHNSSLLATSRMAHQVAASLGKSISELVRKFTVKMHQSLRDGEISPEVRKWVGALKTRKSYRVLRDEHIAERMKRYEDPR